MNKDAIRSVVEEAYADTSVNGESPSVSIEGVVDVLESLGFEIVPKYPEINNDNMFELEETIRAYNSLEEMDLGDVHGEAIIQSLQQRGWVICPPR